jgi:hypothetical protein
MTDIIFIINYTIVLLLRLNKIFFLEILILIKIKYVLKHLII